MKEHSVGFTLRFRCDSLTDSRIVFAFRSQPDWKCSCPFTLNEPECECYYSLRCTAMVRLHWAIVTSTAHCFKWRHNNGWITCSQTAISLPYWWNCERTLEVQLHLTKVTRKQSYVQMGTFCVLFILITRNDQINFSHLFGVNEPLL